MYRIALKPSRYEAIACVLVHAAAMLSVWFTQLPLLALIAINLAVAAGCARNYHVIANRRTQVLELSADSCHLVSGSPNMGHAELHWPVFSLPYLQIMYFHRHLDEQECSQRTLWFRLTEAWNRFPLVLSVDSCSKQDMRRLRAFIRWKMAN